MHSTHYTYIHHVQQSTHVYVGTLYTLPNHHDAKIEGDQEDPVLNFNTSKCMLSNDYPHQNENEGIGKVIKHPPESRNVQGEMKERERKSCCYIEIKGYPNMLAAIHSLLKQKLLRSR